MAKGQREIKYVPRGSRVVGKIGHVGRNASTTKEEEISKDMKEGRSVYLMGRGRTQSSASQNMVPKPAVFASLRNLLEMQIFKPHPTYTESETLGSKFSNLC